MYTIGFPRLILKSVVSGLLEQREKLLGTRIIIFFDWCNSLLSGGPEDWWKKPFPKKMVEFEHVSIIGWTGSPGMVEGMKTLAWVGAERDVLSDDALNSLSKGHVSSVRRLRLLKGKLVDDRVFNRN